LGEGVDLSVVLPAYQEADNLRLLLPRLRESLAGLGVQTETIIVDAIEPIDETASLCAQFPVRYVRRRNSNCFGDAVRTGIAEAHGRHILFMDADGSHAPELIPALYASIGEADIIAASRYVPAGRTENGLILVLMSRLLNVVYGAVLGIPCSDISNSFKLYRAVDIKGLKLISNEFDIVEEIICKVFRNNGRAVIKEIPFTFKVDSGNYETGIVFNIRIIFDSCMVQVVFLQL
jgi:dolichol-phosphate mannosyltransferase